MYIINADGTGLEKLLGPDNDSFDFKQGDYDNPSWSPDGRYLVFDRSEAEAGQRGRSPTDIFIKDMKLSGSSIKQLTNTENWEYEPSFSPDGKKIVFTRHLPSKKGTFTDEIYTMNVDGTDVKRLTNNNRRDRSPSWTADGKSIIFVSDRDSKQSDFEIYIMDSDGEK